MWCDAYTNDLTTPERGCHNVWNHHGSYSTMRIHSALPVPEIENMHCKLTLHLRTRQPNNASALVASMQHSRNSHFPRLHSFVFSKLPEYSRCWVQWTEAQVRRDNKATRMGELTRGRGNLGYDGQEKAEMWETPNNRFEPFTHFINIKQIRKTRLLQYVKYELYF